MNPLLWTGVILLGGVGALLRFLIDDAVSSRTDARFPFGTLAVNLSGAALLGLVTGLAPGHDQALLAGTAAIGSYTTFSTWMLETHRLGEEHGGRPLAANVGVSLLLGFAAVAAGRALGGLL